MYGRNGLVQPFHRLLEPLQLSEEQTKHFEFLMHLATGPYKQVLINNKIIDKVKSITKYPYQVRRIPKANGKMRTIHMPEPFTANAGTLMSLILQNLTDPMSTETTGFLGIHCYSYTQIPYAMQHMAYKFKDCKYILHLDIKDFFGSIELVHAATAVEGFMLALYKKMGYNFPDVDDIEIAYAKFGQECGMNCTAEEHGLRCAVQGSTLTPIISNLVGSITIDSIVKDILTDEVYARFSDDLYIGSNELEALESYVLKIPARIEQDTQFTVNHQKTKIMSKEDKSKFPQVLSMYCDDNGHLKIPSKKGKMMKVAAFKSGSTPYSKDTFSMHMKYKGYLSYIKSINLFNDLIEAPRTATGAHPQFQGSLHYMQKLEKDMLKSYEKGLSKLIASNLRISLDEVEDG